MLSLVSKAFVAVGGAMDRDVNSISKSAVDGNLARLMHVEREANMDMDMDTMDMVV